MKEKNYKKIEDFLTDESFCQWVEKGEAAPFWESWMIEHPEKKALVEEAILVLKGPSFGFQAPAIDPKLIAAEWEKIKEKTIDQQQENQGSNGQPNGRIYSMRPWAIRIAASLAIIAVLGFLVRTYLLNQQVVYQTSFGEQKSIMLPDSTFFKLNANSKLSYHKDNPRKVWVDGEVFFEVKKKPTTGDNFLVITNDLTIEVLGTAFNVVERDDKTEVVLEEGSVKLNLNRAFEPEVYMQPGEMVAFSTKVEQKVEKRSVQSETVTSWKDGVLQFEDVPLTEVMNRIEEIYGWTAIYETENLRSRKISTPLPANDLESTLTILRKAIGIEIEKRETDKTLLLR
jgi:ferric-dicitrate binding protein FerR (iron transport regulator)